MSPHAEEDWSDTDDEFEAGEDVETAVLLGIPDGPIKDSADLEDAAVSRLGGRPVRLFAFPFSLPYFLYYYLLIRINLLIRIFFFVPLFEGIHSERKSEY